MNENELKLIVESLLMSVGEPLTLDNILSAFEEGKKPTREALKNAIAALEDDYVSRAIEIKSLAGGYSVQTKPCYTPWVTRSLVEKPQKYSRALLETLAIISYRQPVTRADIEDIRGVAVSSPILKTLLEREWIRIAGHRDVPGRPALYVTTKEFLNYFNLNNLKELPELTFSEE